MAAYDRDNPDHEPMTTPGPRRDQYGRLAPEEVERLRAYQAMINNLVDPDFEDNNRRRDGQSLDAFDGGTFPPHRRSVSVKMPEIISLSDMKPVFNSEGSRLTNEGKLIDVQMNARKIRISDVQLLFDEMSQSDSEEVRTLLENIIGILEVELQNAEVDVRTIRTLTSSIRDLLEKMDLKKSQDAIETKFQVFRNSRAENTPHFPEDMRESKNFSEILTDNHCIPEFNVRQFSNTKLLMYMFKDLERLLRTVPATNARMTNKRGLLANSQSPVQFDVGDPSTIRGGGEPRFTIVSFDHENSVAQEYNMGILSTVNTNFFIRGNNIRGRASGIDVNSSTDKQIQFYRNNEDNLGHTVATLLTTVCHDAAASAAIANDDDISSIMSVLDPSNSAESLHSLIFKNPIIPGNRQQNTLARIRNNDRISDDASLSKFPLYPAGVDDQGNPVLVPIFDPTLISPAFRSFTSGQLSMDSVIDQFVTPLLTGITQGGELNDTALRTLAHDASSKFSKAADLIDSVILKKGTAFDPETALVTLLKGFAGTISSDIFRSRNAFDLAMLSECWEKQAGTEFNIPIEDQDNFHRPSLSTLSIEYIPMHQLMCGFLAILGRKRGERSRSYFNSFVAHASDQSFTYISNATHYTMTSCPRPGDLTQGIRGGEGGNQLTHRPLDRSDLGTSMGGDDDAPRPAEKSMSGTPGARLGRQVSTNLAQKHFDVDQFVSNLRKYTSLGAFRDQHILNAELISSRHQRGQIGTRARPIEGFNIADRPVGRIFSAGNGNANRVRIDSIGTVRRQSLVAGRANSDNVYTGILNVLDNISQEAEESGGAVIDSDTGKIIFSGVCPTVWISFVLSAASHISRHLEKCTFKTVQLIRQGVNDNRIEGAVGKCVIQFTDYNNEALRFNTDVRRYLAEIENDVSHGAAFENLRAGKFKTFLQEFKEITDNRYRIAADYSDFLRAFGSHIDDAVSSLTSNFRDQEGGIRTDPSFARIGNKLPDLLDYAQVPLAVNAVEAQKEKTGTARYFDSFMSDGTEENILFSAVKGERFRSGRADNLKILCVGIPYGYTENVLGIDPVTNPEEYKTNRKVKILVKRTDLILGGNAKLRPKEFVFDLNMFPGPLSNPIASDPLLRSPRIANEYGAISLQKSVTERPFPGLDSVIANNVQMRIIDPIEGTSALRRRGSFTGRDVNIFNNHALDIIARMYVRLSCGINLDERSFFLDSSLEGVLTTGSERARFNELINARIRQLTGKDLTIDAYLAGSRRTRELFERLKRGEVTSPIIQQITETVEGVSDDINFVVSEELVTFMRMISSTNPLFSPATFSRGIITPKLFERVFCIMVDPDDFQLIFDTEGQLGFALSDPRSRRFLEPGAPGGEGPSYRQILNESRLEQASQFSVDVVPIDTNLEALADQREQDYVPSET